MKIEMTFAAMSYSVTFLCKLCSKSVSMGVEGFPDGATEIKIDAEGARRAAEQGLRNVPLPHEPSVKRCWICSDCARAITQAFALDANAETSSALAPAHTLVAFGDPCEEHGLAGCSCGENKHGVDFSG